MRLDPTKLNYRGDFSMGNLQRLLASIGDSWFLKMVLGGVFTINDWFFHPRHETVTIVLAFVALDTLTGVLKAFKQSQISSSGFFRVAAKVVVYTILLASGALLDKIVEMQNFFSGLSMIGAFLSTTEAISILENVSALGFKTPRKLLSVLKFVQDDDDSGLGGPKKP
jgi:toxin secretion/phage lysis holin